MTAPEEVLPPMPFVMARLLTDPGVRQWLADVRDLIRAERERSAGVGDGEPDGWDQSAAAALERRVTYYETLRGMTDDPDLLAAVDAAERRGPVKRHP